MVKVLIFMRWVPNLCPGDYKANPRETQPEPFTAEGC